jgi:GNAT superfamily N-acetyltransferase
MNTTQKLSNGIKQYGLASFMTLIFAKVGEKFGYYNNRYLILTRELDSPIATPPLAAGYVVKEFSPELLENLSGTWVSEGEINRFKKRLQEPDITGIGIYRESTGELAYYFWLSCRKIEMPPQYEKVHALQLGADEAYLYDGYCHPEHRGHGFHGFAAVYLMNKALSLGKRRAVTIILAINKAAILSQQKVGFKPVKEIIFSGFKNNISCTLREN